MNILMHGRKTVANEEGFTSFTSDWEHILTSDKVLQHLYTIQACGHCGTEPVPLRWKSMEWFWNMHLLEWMFSPCWKKKNATQSTWELLVPHAEHHKCSLVTCIKRIYSDPGSYITDKWMPEGLPHLHAQTASAGGWWRLIVRRREGKVTCSLGFLRKWLIKNLF